MWQEFKRTNLWSPALLNSATPTRNDGGLADDDVKISVTNIYRVQFLLIMCISILELEQKPVLPLLVVSVPVSSASHSAAHLACIAVLVHCHCFSK